MSHRFSPQLVAAPNENVPSISSDLAQRFEALEVRLRQLNNPIALTLNSNRTILISLRGDWKNGVRLSIHPELLNYPDAIHELPKWASGGGRKPTVSIKAALESVGRILRARKIANESPVILEGTTIPVDLQSVLSDVHASYFHQLPKPVIGWTRVVKKANRRHFRFASYRRSPTPRILVSSRLNQPWVASKFIHFVVYHELCHHAQTCDPRRGERAHSPRFRQWERAFPEYERIISWERQHLEKFLQSDLM